MKAKPSGTPIMHVLPSISTTPLKLVKDVLGGVTINDILSTASGRAVWRYLTEPWQSHCDDVSESKESTCISIAQDPHKLAKEYTVSEGFAMAYWTSIPQKPGNKVGGCRINVEPPTHLQRKAFGECRMSIITDLLVKKKEIKFRAKDLNLGRMVKIATHLVPNHMPTFLFDLLTKPRRVLTYIMSNVRGLPVTYELMGLTMNRMFIVPPFLAQIFGKPSSFIILIFKIGLSTE
jgi:hypothetical protein